MKLEVLRRVLPVVVALIIPLFFLLLYLASAYHRLALLRAGCQRTWAVLIEALRRQVGLLLEINKASPHPPAAALELAKVRAAGTALVQLLETTAQCQDAPWAAAPGLAAARKDWDAALVGLGGEPVPDGGTTGSGPERGRSIQCELEEARRALTSADAGYHRAMSEYNAARPRFPASVLAVVFAFPPAVSRGFEASSAQPGNRK